MDAIQRALGRCKGGDVAAAVRVYADERYAASTERVASCSDPREAIRAMLAVIADVDGGTRGCLFVNAVAELAPGDAELVALAQSHTARVGALMYATLRRLGCTVSAASERAGALPAPCWRWSWASRRCARPVCRQRS